MKDSLENQVGKFRREEGFRNANDIYDLTGLKEETRNPEKIELVQMAREFTTDMQTLLKDRLGTLIVESQQHPTPIPPEIIAYMEKTGMNLAQFSMFKGDSAISKTIEYGLDKMKDEKYMIGSSKVTATGSVVIPADIRKREGINPGDRVSLVAVGNKIIIQKPDIEPLKKAIAALEKIGKV